MEDLSMDHATIDKQLAERERPRAALAVVPDVVPVRSTRDLGGLDMVPDLQSVLALADVLGEAAGFLPKWIVSKGQAVAVLLAGRELGIPPMRAFRVLHMIEGKVELAASEMLALLMRGGVRIQWVRSDDTIAHVRMERPGQPPHEETFSMDDARRAKLSEKDPWKKYPKAMLRARCASAAARWYAPDLLGNVYVEGEISEAITPGASYSPEVRELGASVHEASEPAEGPDPMAAAMGLLGTLKSDDDLWSWIAAWGAKYTREPDSTRKREQWKTITATGKKVTPPMTIAEVKEAFRLGGKRPKPAADAVDGETEESPGDRALAELSQCETREMMQAWCEDNREYLASIPQGTPAERVTWIAIRKRATEIGDVSIADDLEGALS